MGSSYGYVKFTFIGTGVREALADEVRRDCVTGGVKAGNLDREVQRYLRGEHEVFTGNVCRLCENATAGITAGYIEVLYSDGYGVYNAIFHNGVGVNPMCGALAPKLEDVTTVANRILRENKKERAKAEKQGLESQITELKQRLAQAEAKLGGAQ